jgi:hypothetical protein
LEKPSKLTIFEQSSNLNLFSSLLFFLSLFEDQPIKNENPDLEKVGIFYVFDSRNTALFFE